MQKPVCITLNSTNKSESGAFIAWWRRATPARQKWIYLEARNAHNNNTGKMSPVCNVTVWWPTVQNQTEKQCSVFVAVRSSCSPLLRHMEAPQSRIHASPLVLAWRLQKKKYRSRSRRKGGLFLNALAPTSDAPCAGWGGSRQAGSASSYRRIQRGAHYFFSPVPTLLLLLPLLLDFSLGFSSCDKLDFTSSCQNMYSAALLLMLAVRIYADSMEGPTGKKTHLDIFGHDAQCAPVHLLVKVALKSPFLFHHSLDI